MIDREEELLHRYLDGQLSDDEIKEFEAALEADESLRHELEAFAQVGDMLRTHIDENVESMAFESFYSDLESKLDAEDAQKSESVWDQIRGFLFSPAGAASLVVAAVVIFFVARPDVSPEPPVNGVDVNSEGLVESGKSPAEIKVENETQDGNHLIKVSKPVNKDERTVIWLMEKEKGQDKDAGVGTDATEEKPF